MTGTAFPNWIKSSNTIYVLYFAASSTECVYSTRLGGPKVFTFTESGIFDDSGEPAEQVTAETVIFDFMDFPEVMNAVINDEAVSITRIPALLPQATHIAWPYRRTDGTGVLYYVHHVGGGGGFQVFEAAMNDGRIWVGTASL